MRFACNNLFDFCSSKYNVSFVFCNVKMMITI